MGTHRVLPGDYSLGKSNQNAFFLVHGHSTMTAAKRIIELLWVAAALGAYLGKAGTWQANWGWKILVFLSGAHLG